MKIWFESKVQYIKVDETSGKEKKVTEEFLFDAVSWTDAEAKTYKEMEQMISGEFRIKNITKSTLAEVYPYDSGEYWFKVMVDMVTVDEGKGIEKVSKLPCLIMADDIQEALNRTNESLNDMLVPFVISNIGISKIMDVFPYFGEEKE